jgi:SOS response regulatory protein OraA/RecX
MQDNQSVTEVLQKLKDKGYHLADNVADMAEEAIKSADWKLDTVEQVQEDGKKLLLIAVSSVRKRLKLVFVEHTFSPSDFSPMALLRKLFPKRNK